MKEEISMGKKTVSVLIAIFSIFLVTSAAFASGAIDVSVNDEPIARYGTSEKSGGHTLQFLNGTTLNAGEQITMDLDLNVYNANSVDIEISPGGDAENNIANRWNAGNIPTSDAPVTQSAPGVVTCPGNGLYLRISAVAGTARTTIDILGDPGDSLIVGGGVSDYLQIKFFDQKTNTTFLTDGIWIPDALDVYNVPGTIGDNTLCIDVSGTEAGSVDGHYDSAGDVFFFDPSVPTIAHMGPSTTASFVSCKDREPGHIELGDRVSQGSENCVAFDNESGAGMCADHVANDIVLTASPSFELLSYDVTFEILVNGATGDNGVYWSNVAPTADGWTTLDLACAGPAVNGLGVITYELASGAAATPIAPLSMECDLDSVDRAVLMRAASTGLNLTSGDDFLSFDLPPLNYDLDNISDGDVISVRVSVNKIPCGQLFTGDWEIGTFGCPALGVSSSLLYPYFTQMDTAADPFWDGIAITNTSSAAGTVNLTIYEADGDVATMTVNIPAHSMYVNLLSAMIGSMTMTTSVDGTLGNARCYITAMGNVNLDGFAMIAYDATGESMGYLPRQM
jgi:hypothetical protein